ncbi:MAG: putative ATPase [Chthonomonadaceae bacterium]|nr:putative ATPase [Chthonomonadaceae bacterium]
MPVLPTGTLTYLLTDIAGSTRLWDEHAEGMRQAHPRHSDIITDCVERFQGRVVRERAEGDSRFAVFTNPLDGVRAALAIQQALHAESWPLPTPLRVRIAVHTGGSVGLTGDDYASPGANRCARLRALAAGGQTLLSRATVELVTDHLPPDLTLRSLGTHRLKDLERPEQVFQLCHPTLPDDFPLLFSLDSLPTNLPGQINSFVGRERAMQDVKRLLGQTRLLTLLGAGGTGKTRLSLQAGADLLDQFPDGVWLAELAALSDSALVWQEVAAVLSVREEAGMPIVQTLKAALQPKTLLLILDNCEHLIGTCAEMAQTLLQSCPHLRILASSREVLNVQGEVTYYVPSLSLPAPTEKTSNVVERLLDFEAVRLFVERAQASLSTFTLTAENAEAVVQVCRRLDGIPLALELAAVRAKTLSPAQLLARLDDRFRLLTTGSRTTLPRQQTLRALIDWSYDLLSERERCLWARLSVFASGWRLEAAEQVCAGGEIEEWEALDLLTQLVDKSIVLAEEREGAVRYRMLESIRAYGQSRLEERGSAAEIHAQYTAFYLAFVEEANRYLRGPEQTEWIARLDTERENIYAAFDLCLMQAQEPADLDATERVLRFAVAESDYWRTCGYLTEGRRRLTAVLALSNAPCFPSVYAACLNAAGILAWLQCDYPEARQLITQCLERKRALNDPSGVASALGNLGNIAKDEGDYGLALRYLEEGRELARTAQDTRTLGVILNTMGAIHREQGRPAQAMPLLEESLELRRKVGDKRGVSLTLNNLGSVLRELGEHARARAMQEASLAVLREIGDRQNMAILLNNLGNRAKEAGDPEAARTYLEECWQLSQDLGDRQNAAIALVNLGSLAEETGASDRAAAHYAECLRLCRALGEKMITGYALNGLALLALHQEDWPRALLLLTATAALRERVGTALTPEDRAEHEKALTTLRTHLEPEIFEALCTQGRSMELSTTIAYALGEKIA